MADWEFELDELEEEDEEDDEIRPGDPSAENVAFVLLGALATLAIVARFWLLVP